MNSIAKNQPAIPKLLCSIFGHQYEVSKKVTYHVKEYKCRGCKKELTTNGSGNLIELTPKYKEINSVLSRIHKKRMARLGREVLTNNYRLSS